MECAVATIFASLFLFVAGLTIVVLLVAPFETQEALLLFGAIGMGMAIAIGVIGVIVTDRISRK